MSVQGECCLSSVLFVTDTISRLRDDNQG